MSKLYVQFTWENTTNGRGNGNQCQAFLPISIGRHPNNDIELTGGQVSRTHARVDVINGHVYLFDESTNGTIVNGTLVRHSQVQLRHGDQFRIGEFLFTYKQLPPQVVCHNCGHQVSRLKPDCPYCGYHLAGI